MSKNFDELISVMARLRAPGGCPWDREQTYASLAQYLLEETYETFDAIQEADQTGDTRNLREELGDVLLQVVFHSTIAAEKNDFTIDEVVKGVTEKLVLRHPHVFGDKKLETANDVLQNWDELKKSERKISGKEEKKSESLLDEVSLNFPALLEALKLTKKAAKVGFDWENTQQIFAKLNEEIEELEQAISEQIKEKISEEIGDILFVIVNLARKLEIEPETALKKTNRKFRRRFKFIESELKSGEQKIEETSLEAMDELWNKAKDLENSRTK